MPPQSKDLFRRDQAPGAVIPTGATASVVEWRDLLFQDFEDGRAALQRRIPHFILFVIPRGQSVRGGSAFHGGLERLRPTPPRETTEDSPHLQAWVATYLLYSLPSRFTLHTAGRIFSV